MAGTLHRRFWVLLGAAVAACVAWFWLPGSGIDRLAFSVVTRGFANPPLFISGKGSADSPWNLRTFATGNRADTRQAPVIVSLGDDREGFFQSSPPSPIDLAVVLNDFHRLGTKNAATAVVLAWDAPDPNGLAALDKVLGRFDTLVMAAPLSRGAVSEPMPAAFRRASVAVDSVRGDVTALPVVNRIPLPGVILGGNNAAAGFQTLDSEPDGKFAPLLARWEDRVVFAFPLLCVLQRLELPVTGLEIRPGESIKFGPHGPIVPIDRFGRLAVPLQNIAPLAEISAEEVVHSAETATPVGECLFPRDAPGPVVLRDDRSAAEPATRAFSKSLPTVIAALASDRTLAPARDFPRLQPRRELGLLLLVALALTAFCTLPVFSRNTVFLTIAAIFLATQCVAAGAAGLWLPGLPALVALACGWVLSGMIAVTPADPLPAREPRRKSKPEEVPATVTEVPDAVLLGDPPVGRKNGSGPVALAELPATPDVVTESMTGSTPKTARKTVPENTTTPAPTPKPKATRKTTTKKSLPAEQGPPPPPPPPPPEPPPVESPAIPPAPTLKISSRKSRTPAKKRRL